MKYSLWTRSVSLLLAVLMVLAIPAAAVEVPESQTDGASTTAEGGTDAVQDPFDSSADTVLPAQEDQQEAGSTGETEQPEPVQQPETPEEQQPQQPETPAVEETPVYLDKEGNYLAPEELVLTLISFADGESANNRKMEQYTGIVAFYDYNERDVDKMLEHPYFFYYEKGVLQDEEERFSRADRYMSLASAPTKTAETDGEGAEQLVYLAEEVYVDPEAETHPDYLFVFNQDEGDNGLYTGGADGVAYIDGQTFAVPVTLSQNETTGGEPTLIWEKQEGATGYQVYRRISGAEWGSSPLATVGSGVNTYTDRTANKAGTTYEYQIKAVKDGAVSGDGAVVSYTCHAIPTVTVKSAAGGVQVTWTRDSAATGYQVLRKASNAASWTTAGSVSNTSSGSTVKWQDAGAASNVTYTYAVRAYYGERTENREAYTANVWSGQGTSGSVYYLAAPTLTNVYSENGGMTLKWSAVTGAVKYRVYQRAANDKSWTNKGTVNASTRSMTMTGVTAGSGYYYTVRAINAQGVMGPYFDDSGDASKQITYHGTPAVTLKNGDGVIVKWSKDAAATGYRVYRKQVGTSGWTIVANVTSGKTTSYTDTEAVSGTSYVYTVRAYYGTIANISKDTNYKTNLWSGYQASATLLYVAPAKLSRVYTGANGMILKWNEVPKATGYYVYVQQSDKTWKRIAQLNGGKTTTYTDKTAKAGSSYVYTVVAVLKDSAGTVHRAGYIAADAAVYHTTPVVTVANGAKGIGVTWTQDKAAVGYRVFRKTGKGSWEVIANVTAESLAGKSTYLTDDGAKLTCGTVYSYTVRAYYGDVSKLSSAALDSSNLWSHYVGKTVTYLTAPVLKSTATTEQGVKVQWTKVSGAAGYRIYRRAASSTKWTRLGDVSNGSTEVYVDSSKLNAGTSYYYTVRAIGADKTSMGTYDKTGVYAVYLPAPELISAVVSSKGTQVKWNVVKGADGYRVYRKSAGGKWTMLSTVVGENSLSYLDTAVKNDSVTYYYTVKPYKAVTLNGKQTTLQGAYESSGITFSVPMSGSGWVKKNGNTYYVKNGYCLTGWQYLSRNGGNYKYYFDSKTGALVTNLYSYFGKSYRNLKCRVTVCLNSSNSNPSNATIYLYDSETDSYCIPAVSFRCVANQSKTLARGTSGFMRVGAGQRWLDSISNYEQYATYVSGTPGWFHSVLYRSQNPNSLIYSTYNSMVNNSNSSNGCIRTQCIYAFLIQDIMKNGYGKSNRVSVSFYKNASQPGPFGVPKIDKISSRKTDPTDPAVTGKFFYETSIWGVNAKAGASAWATY